MLLFLGGLVGVLLGTCAASVAVAAFATGPSLPAVGPLVSALLVLVGPLAPLALVVVGLFTLIVLTVVTYTLAAVGLLPGIAMTPPTSAPTPLPVSPLENAMRGVLIGMSAGVDLVVWTLLPLGLALGGPLALIVFLTVFPGVSRSGFFQGVLGWLSWFLPLTYLVQPVGIVFFLVNLPFALAGGGAAALRFDPSTCTVETTGGLAGSTGFRGGFNLGNFTFLATGPGTPPASAQTPFGAPGLSAHETGHTVTIAAFGGVFGWVNAVDENVPPFRRLALAYGELIPESHLPRGGLVHVRVWS